MNETMPTFTPEQQAYLKGLEDGASSGFVLTGGALIFFMQAGFILVECSAILKSHYSDVVAKNMLDSITGALGFWMAGFAIAFGDSSGKGFFGTDGDFYATRGLDDQTDEDYWMKFFFQFAFVNTASTIVSGLLTERCRIEVYAVFSFLMSLIIYPVVAHWAWAEDGWLYVRGYEDFAGSGVIHLLGGLTGLVGAIFCGSRIGHKHTKLQFPCLSYKCRRDMLEKYERSQMEEIQNMAQHRDIKHLLKEGKINDSDLQNMQLVVQYDFKHPELENESIGPVLLGLGTMILFVGWFFFNGASAITLFDKDMKVGRIITNTVMAGASGGATAFFFKVSIFKMGWFQVPGQPCLQISHLYDAGSLCNGILSGLVAITAPCNVTEPRYAVVIGVIAGLNYSFFVKLLDKLNIDDPVEAAAVHYANGVWGLIACAIFDIHKGFVSDYDDKGYYLGIQIAAALAISLWGFLWAFTYFGFLYLIGLLKYHPALEIFGIGNFKMGEISRKFKLRIHKRAEQLRDAQGLVGFRLRDNDPAPDQENQVIQNTDRDRDSNQHDQLVQPGNNNLNYHPFENPGNARQNDPNCILGSDNQA